MSDKLTMLNGRLRVDTCGGPLVISPKPGGTEPCCCCGDGCIITTTTLIRPIVWPGVERCSVGWSKYTDVSSHPANCRSNTDWRIINLPTCQIIASGKIESGQLVGLPNRTCYPMPYEPPCPNRGPFTVSSILWLPLAYLAYAANLFDIDFLVALFGSAMVALHCDGDLTCRYVLQLETACQKEGKLVWPSPDPCVMASPVHAGVWEGGGGDFPVP